jgi:hypothetical protein
MYARYAFLGECTPIDLQNLRVGIWVKWWKRCQFGKHKIKKL